VQKDPRREEHIDVDWLTLVQQHVRSLRFGVVQIVVHDGQTALVEKTEKVRLDLAIPK
jgi:hypothetical protein